VLPDAFDASAPFISELIKSLVGVGAKEQKDEIRIDSEPNEGKLELLGMKMLHGVDESLAKLLVECCCSPQATSDKSFVEVCLKSSLLILRLVNGPPEWIDSSCSIRFPLRCCRG